MSSLIISIDSGTSSNRIIIYNASSGNIEYVSQKEVKQYFPQTGWVEEDPIEIFESVAYCLNEAVYGALKNGFLKEDFKCIGITNQRETTIVWDKSTGKPLYNAIVWSDTRTHNLVQKFVDKSMKNQYGFLEIVGLPLSTYFSALKICWLLEEVENIRNALSKGNLLFGTVDTWLIWKLTNGKSHFTDVTNASRTMLMNLKTLQWDDEMCRFFDLSKTILPEIKSSSDLFGVIECVEEDNPLFGIPITGVIGDQQASLVGQNCVSFGQTKCTFGTGAFLLTNIGQELQFSKDGLLTTVAYQFSKDSKPYFAFEGSVPVAAAAINWLRDNFGLFSKIETELDQMVMSVQDNGGCYFVPAFNGLFCPYWRSDARGVIVGLSQSVNKCHLCRATMESIAFQVRDVLGAMKSGSESSSHAIKVDEIKIDGGLTKSHVFNQILADIIGINVFRPESVEATALGAAIAAAHGKNIPIDKLFNLSTTIFAPSLTHDEKENLYSKWKIAVKKCFN